MVIKRVNTLKIKFNRAQQRPQAAEIHEFILETLNLTLDQLYGIQLNSNENTVYVKLVSNLQFERTLQTFQGHVSCKLYNGDVVDTQISDAGVEETQLRLFNLPFETSDDDIKKLIAPYGRLKSIAQEHWSRQFKVNGIYNGLRAVNIELIKPVPSFLTMEGHRIQVIYDGQPQTCHICNSLEHFRNDCPSKRSSDTRIIKDVLPISRKQSEQRLFKKIVKPVSKLRDELQSKGSSRITLPEPPEECNVHDNRDITGGTMLPNVQIVDEEVPENDNTVRETMMDGVATSGPESVVWAEDVETLHKNIEKNMNKYDKSVNKGSNSEYSYDDSEKDLQEENESVHDLTIASADGNEVEIKKIVMMDVVDTSLHRINNNADSCNDRGEVLQGVSENSVESYQSDIETTIVPTIGVTSLSNKMAKTSRRDTRLSKKERAS